MRFSVFGSLFVGVFCLAGDYLTRVDAKVATELSYRPVIQKSHSLAIRSEGNDDDDDDRDDDQLLDDTVEAVSTEQKPSRHREPWRTAEDERLVKLREEGNSWAEVARKFPERSPIALKSRYSVLTRDPLTKKRKVKAWTEKENKKLLKLMETEASWEERAVFMPGRSGEALKAHYAYLKAGAKVPKKYVRNWTEEEDALLLELREAGMPIKEMVPRFHRRTERALLLRHNKLKPPPKGRLGNYTPKEDAELIEALGLRMTVDEIADLIGRERRSVRRRIKMLEKSGQIERPPHMRSRYVYTDADFVPIIDKVQQGIPWDEIAREHFPGQTPTSVQHAYELREERIRRKLETDQE